MNSEDLKEKQNKAGNPIFILIIFIALLGFLFFVPEIYKKFNGNFMNFFGGGNKTEEDKKKPDDLSPVSAFYQLGSNGSLKFNEITLSDISLGQDKILKLTINAEEDVDLDEKDYYVEFFKNRKTFVGRRVLHGKVVKNLPVELDVSNLDVDTTTYMVVSHIGEITKPKDELSSDESGLSSITCTKGNESYEYEFYLQRLTKTIYKYNYENSDLDEYAEKLLAYQKQEKAYNTNPGVTARIVENGNTFIFISEFDNREVETFSNMKDSKLYDRDTVSYIVKFKMDAEGYECE